MDKLEQALKDKHFYIEFTDIPFLTIKLYGKTNHNNTLKFEYYEVSGKEFIPEKNYVLKTFVQFKSYDTMKKWLDEWKGEGFYNHLLKLYEKEL